MTKICLKKSGMKLLFEIRFPGLKKLKPLPVILIYFLLLSENHLCGQDTISDRLNLKECIEFGLKNNPGLQSSLYLVEEMKAKTDEALSGYYPAVSLNSDADAYSKNNGSQRYNNISSGINLSYNIFQGNRIKATYGASQDNYQASRYNHETLRQDLVFSIIRAYYRILQSEWMLRSSEESVNNSRLHLDFARARQKAGMATRSDILKSEVELSNAELERIKASNTLLAAQGDLNQLLGMPADNDIRLVDDLSLIDKNFLPAYDSLLNEAFSMRTELKRYQSLMNAQMKYIQVAKSGYYPSLNANANYNYAGPEISAMEQNWWMGMTLSIPLFKGFSTKARVSQEEYALKGLEKDFELLKHQISQEVWNAWLAVKESYERIETSEKAFESARENLSLAEGEYKEGVGSMIQLTDAQTTFVSIEQNYIQALADYKISFAELERTIGR